MAKLWGGRFSKNTNELVDAFNASIEFDKRLYHEDIRGSIAHATMLAKCGIIPEEDEEKIVAGLKDILKDIEAGNFEFDIALEDIHMNIEARLTERIGAAGARLHTARSRNDQVALDMHMYMKREVVEIAELLVQFEEALLSVAKKHDKTLMPGTHIYSVRSRLLLHIICWHILTCCSAISAACSAYGKVRTLCRSAPAPLQAQLSRLTVFLWQNS